MEHNCEYERLLRQGSPDDAVHLFVDIQFGQTAALGVISHTDGHRLGALGDRHRDLKQLQKEQKTEELVRHEKSFMLFVFWSRWAANGNCGTEVEEKKVYMRV